MPEARKEFTAEQAREGWRDHRHRLEQRALRHRPVARGHGRRAGARHARPPTDVTGSDPVITGKIALAHLNEFPDYYTRLARMEEEAKRDWERRR